MPRTSLVLFSTLLCVGSPASAADVRSDRLLGVAEVRAALSGRVIAYAAEGWADAGVQEEFQENGIWKGIYYSRGPIGFSGRWTVIGNQLCVTPDQRSIIVDRSLSRKAKRVLCGNESGPGRPICRDQLILITRLAVEVALCNLPILRHQGAE